MTKEEAIKRLKEEIKKGDTLYTQLNHVSQSGMTRHISVRQIKLDKISFCSFRMERS